jgi:tetratricopeptide (TPR) repeat protein
LSNLSMGDVRTATNYAKEITSNSNNNQLADLLIFADHIKNERYGLAHKILKRNEENYTELLFGLLNGWTELGRGKMSSVLKTFDKMKSNSTLRLFGQYHKALALAAVGDFETADKILSGNANGSLRLTRGSLIAHAQIMAELSKEKEALELIDNMALKGQDKELDILRQKIQNSSSTYNYVTSAKQGIAEVLFTLAFALNGSENDQTSLLYGRLAQNLRPNNAETILLTSELLRDQKQFDLAIENYEKIQKDNGLYLSAEIGRVETLIAADKPDLAIDALKKLSVDYKDSTRVLMSLGDAYRGQKKFTLARSAYDKTQSLIGKPNSSHWFLFYSLGICNERLGNWPRAEMNFRKALDLSPNQPLILNYLGYSLVEKNKNLQEARDMIEKAVAARPNSGFIIDSLGWSLFTLGNFEDAIHPMERAVELMPDDPIVNDHLGDVYWKVGRKREARFQWKRAISFDPEEKELIRIRKKLDIGLDKVQAEEKKK